MSVGWIFGSLFSRRESRRCIRGIRGPCPSTAERPQCMDDERIDRTPPDFRDPRAAGRCRSISGGSPERTAQGGDADRRAGYHPPSSIDNAKGKVLMNIRVLAMTAVTVALSSALPVLAAPP